MHHKTLFSNPPAIWLLRLRVCLFLSRKTNGLAFQCCILKPGPAAAVLLEEP
jgi:hypothetical protein